MTISIIANFIRAKSESHDGFKGHNFLEKVLYGSSAHAPLELCFGFDQCQGLQGQHLRLCEGNLRGYPGTPEGLYLDPCSAWAPVEFKGGLAEEVPPL